ncbi:hypothetical protein BDR04DRAFT_628624 [Suillus decipiens]|nr:hypothetical protein BDR04DRAFT_628624 [Suillus decipiens]
MWKPYVHLQIWFIASSTSLYRLSFSRNPERSSVLFSSRPMMIMQLLKLLPCSGSRLFITYRPIAARLGTSSFLMSHGFSNTSSCNLSEYNFTASIISSSYLSIPKICLSTRYNLFSYLKSAFNGGFSVLQYAFYPIRNPSLSIIVGLEVRVVTQSPRLSPSWEY